MEGGAQDKLGGWENSPSPTPPLKTNKHQLFCILVGIIEKGGHLAEIFFDWVSFNEGIPIRA